MKYTSEITDGILELHNQGYSSRQIAVELNISKSGVNDFLKRVRNGEHIDWGIPETRPKILIFDLETSAAEVLAFGRNKQFISDDSVLKEGGKILTAAWKWLGEEQTEFFGDLNEVVQGSDETVTAVLWDLFNEADAVVAHNALNFDVKVLRTRCLTNGLPPLPTVKILDTLVMAKRNFRFPTNRLNTLAQYLGFGEKVDTGGISLWRDVQSGDPEAFLKMIEYNIQDVVLLEKVYLALRSYGHAGSTFNQGHYHTGKAVCPVCGSEDLEKTGRVVSTAVSLFEEIRCGGCGAVHRTRQAVNTREERSKLTVPILN
jgi:transposase-like protein